MRAFAVGALGHDLHVDLRQAAQQGLHHLTGSRLKLAFLGQRRVTVTNHRYVLHKAARAQGGDTRFRPKGRQAKRSLLACSPYITNT